MKCTFHDVSFALSMVSLIHGNLGRDNWTTVKNILKYLRRTKDLILVLGGSDSLRVTVYSDDNFQTDRYNLRSQSGWVFLLNGTATTWKFPKRERVIDSTCDLEYIAASEASNEAAWLKNFIDDLRVVPTIQEPLELFCYNEGALKLLHVLSYI
ncbi:secreted RxLR effector protein 161-like [Lactuca sativa]|uniref:secreted RxLR effector protein 161-like n=1 Tax=Lactuca sativa TaxID=4236 RepID=UPI001C68E3F5|nr:secreted RxLR effector protein 161-like [Lactuca sativa]